MEGVLGIDPGKSGAFAVLDRRTKKIISVLKSANVNGGDIADWIHEIQNAKRCQIVYAAIERVNAMPKQGVASSFNFGLNYGRSLGILDALRIPYDLVSPQTWQKELKCLTKGDKNITKDKARRIWPSYQVTHADADALLIALWAINSNPHWKD